MINGKRSTPGTTETDWKSIEATVFNALQQIATRLGGSLDRSQLELPESIGNESSTVQARHLEGIHQGCSQLGIRVSEMEEPAIAAIVDVVADGFPVVLICDNRVEVLTDFENGKFQTVLCSKDSQFRRRHWRSVKKQIRKQPNLEVWIAQDELECQSLEARQLAAKHLGKDLGKDVAPHAKSHPSPLRRFLRLLKMDRRDVLTVFLFAFVSSLLALATPLAVESLVNVVSWGVVWQPLLVLSGMLLLCLGLAGVLKVLQTVMIELIQERQLVRIVGDLSHRFPRAPRSQFNKVYPREFANRVFDIMTIQKATATLLFDGVSIFLSTVMGLVLLAVYHPYLLGFDLVLVLTMVSLTLLLGRGGIRTAIQESVVKYKIAHWLQDVIDFPAAFSINGGQRMAIDRANRLVAEYVQMRTGQFRVVLRQVIFAVSLQVIASTALLGLGGWLVIQGELTLGQLVASELVVTVVVGAFAKAGKSLEIYYDLMAGTDKVGYLIDVQTEQRLPEIALPSQGPLILEWEALTLDTGAAKVGLAAGQCPDNQIVAIRDHGCGVRSNFATAIVGLHEPEQGFVRYAGHDVVEWTQQAENGPLAMAGNNEVFHGSVMENISLGRAQLGRTKIREALEKVKLWDMVSHLDDGMETVVQTAGRPFNQTQVAQLMIARAIAIPPKLLVIDGLLDTLGQATLDHLWPTLQSIASQGTVVVTTNRQEIADRCDKTIWLEDLK